MLPVELSLLELAPVQPSEAPVRFAYKKWVAAGKPCLRQNCGHPHAVHIPAGLRSAINATARGLLASHILTIADAAVATITTAYNDQ